MNDPPFMTSSELMVLVVVLIPVAWYLLSLLMALTDCLSYAVLLWLDINIVILDPYENVRIHCP